MQVIEAIVLKIIPYNDKQKIVRIFSKQSGTISFIVSSYLAKKKGEQIQPLQIVQIEYEHNDRGTFQRLNTISPIVPLNTLYFDIIKMNILLLWSELLDTVLRIEKQNVPLYEYLYTSILYLDNLQEGIANYNLYFLYKLPAFIGFKINTLSYHDGYSFNIENGQFVAPTSELTAVAGPNAARIIFQISTHPLEHIATIQLNRQSRAILLDILIRYLSEHLNTELRTKSLEVIRSVFND